jgi:N-acetylneuraminic acid mutarotase
VLFAKAFLLCSQLNKKLNNLIMRKNILFISLLLIGIVSLVRCSKDDHDIQGNWVEIGEFSGLVREDAVSFVIGDVAYFGTGFCADDSTMLQDLWSVSINSKLTSWSQIASFPGEARSSAVAFSDGTYGYVGLGSDLEGNYFNDFYKYDPTTDSWSEISSFPGTKRKEAVAFYVDGYAYVGTGYDDEVGNLRDMYKFDPDTESWSQLNNAPSKRTDAITFVLEGDAYILAGYNNGYLDDFYRYDADEDSWTELEHISDYQDDYSFDDDYTIQRRDAVAFVVGGKAYVTTGYNGSVSQECWEWDPSDDRWDDKTDFEGFGRRGAVSFVLNSVAYVTCGGTGSTSYDDVWYFEPDAQYDNQD